MTKREALEPLPEGLSEEKFWEMVAAIIDWEQTSGSEPSELAIRLYLLFKGGPNAD